MLSALTPSAIAQLGAPHSNNPQAAADIVLNVMYSIVSILDHIVPNERESSVVLTS
jgi:hypothetical protein